MKRHRLHFTLLFVATFIVSCSKSVPPLPPPPPPPKPTLTVEAEVTHGHYSSFGNNPIVSPYEYHVAFRVTNSGTIPVEFSEIVTAWIPKNGKPLISTTRNVEGMDLGANEDIKKKLAESPVRTWTLKPGDEHKQDVDTNGYTFNLLNDAGDAPLQLHIDFRKDGKSVVPTHIADLPPLNELTMYEQTLVDKEKKGTKLEFRRSN